MKKLVLTAAIILGFAMGSYAQGLYYKDTENGLFKRGAVPENQTRDDGAGLFLPGDGWHGIGGNADATDITYDDNEYDWESHLTPLGSGALLLIGFGAAYAMARRKKED